MKAIIQNSSKELAGNLIVADSIFSRMKGLLGRNFLPEGTALWLIPCKGVHTFGMKFPIDVIMIDRENRVIAINANLMPNRITSIYPSAATVMELPAGSAAAVKLVTGDILEVTG